MSDLPVSALESLPGLDARSKAERAADVLEERIRTLAMPVGTFLGTKATLRAQLRVSPATLDTALGVLSDRGLIEIRPGVKGGVRVAGTQASLFMGRARWPVTGTTSDAVKAGEAMALYLALQSHVVARAVPAATTADRKALRAVRTRLVRSASDAAAYFEAHLAVHLALLDAGHDEVLSLVVRGLMAILDATTGQPMVPRGEDAESYLRERVAVHVAVLDAVLERDLEAAWHALLAHGITPSDVEADAPVLPAGALEADRRWRAAFESSD